MAAREPACNGNGVTEVGRRSSSSPPLSFDQGEQKIIFLKNSVHNLVFKPDTFSTSGKPSNHLAMAPRCGI